MLMTRRADVLQALQTKIDDMKAQFEEANSAHTELKASFQDDPQALTPWMNACFSTFDLGISTFAVSGSLLPTDLKQAFSERNGEETTEGIEKLLVAFKKRCVLERGPEGAPRLLFRMSPNMFRGPVTDETVTAAISRLMEVSGIDPEGETPGSLDIVELCWWDEELADPVPALRLLSAMCKDQTATDEETGEVTITTAKKICALGVHGMSAKCAGSLLCNVFPCRQQQAMQTSKRTALQRPDFGTMCSFHVGFLLNFRCSAGALRPLLQLA